MHFFDIDAMHRRFRFAQHAKDMLGLRLHVVRQIRRADKLHDTAQMAVFGRFIHSDAEFNGADAAAQDAIPPDRGSDCERFKSAREGFAVGARIGKRSNQHVSRQPGERVDVTNSHDYFSLESASRQAPVVRLRSLAGALRHTIPARMPLDTSVPEQTTENRYRARLRLLWQRGFSRRTSWTILILSIPLLAFLIVAGFYYHRYSSLIDAQLLDGPFSNSLNIYGAAGILNDGDALTAGDIEAELRLTGYGSANNGKPGTFHESSQGLDVIPLAGTGGSPVRIVISADREILRIEINGRDVKTWTAGYPLLENLSPGREKRRMVTFHDLPPTLVNAVVSVEDKHFFHHSGLDLPRIVKAAWIDIREGRKEQGASTLTMQLVRGLWLHPGKRWKRKAAEAMMAIHLERKWSKEEIFTAYANLIFLGREQAYSIHGFAEASQLFFGKAPRGLTLPEAALLAGMVQRPSYFNPYRNPEHAKERRDVVLGLMLDNRYITASAYRKAIETPIALVRPADRNNPLAAPYFLDLVSDELRSIDQPEDGARSVYTTIDLNLQRAAGEAIRTGMDEVDKLLAKRYGKGGPKAEAALIALDPHTGEIKALIGGRDYAGSQLNRIFAKRPPGSVFKPFVYAAAMNTGVEGGEKVLTPVSTVDDAPTTFVFDN